MEFTDRRAKTKFHILTSSAGGTSVHSSFGSYPDAAQALESQRRELPSGSWIGGNHDAESLVAGFSPATHTTCDYCNKPATHISREGGEPYCASCGKANYDKPREALAKLTPKTVRMYGRSAL